MYYEQTQGCTGTMDCPRPLTSVEYHTVDCAAWRKGLRPLDVKTLELFKGLLKRDREHGPHTWQNGVLKDRYGTTVMREIGKHRPQLIQAMVKAVHEHNLDEGWIDHGPNWVMRLQSYTMPNEDDIEDIVNVAKTHSRCRVTVETWERRE